MILNKCLSLGSGKVPDQLVNLILQHGVEAKTYEEVCVSGWWWGRGVLTALHYEHFLI